MKEKVQNISFLPCYKDDSIMCTAGETGTWYSSSPFDIASCPALGTKWNAGHAMPQDYSNTTCQKVCLLPQ